MIKAIFFDFDGVLTPDKTGGTTTSNYIHKKTKIEFDKIRSCYKNFNHDLNIGKVTHQDIWADFCKCLGEELDISILNEAFESTCSNDAMFKLARDLKAKYKLGIITDNKKDRLDVVSRKFGLAEIFDAIILSADAGCVKDERKLFETALRSLGIKADESVFIDNKEKNLIVPKQMGFYTIFYDDEKNDIDGLIDELRSIGVDI